MADCIAQIIVADEVPLTGGAVPTHQLLLFDNDRPNWRLLPIGVAAPADAPSLVPRGPDAIERDALVLVAVEIIRDPAVVRAVSAFRRGRLLDLDRGPTGEQLAAIDGATRAIVHWPGMFLTRLDRDANRIDPKHMLR